MPLHWRRVVGAAIRCAEFLWMRSCWRILRKVEGVQRGWSSGTSRQERARYSDRSETAWWWDPILQPKLRKSGRSQVSQMAKVILSVPNISCEHCQRTITSALVPVAGVQSVNVDIPTRQVTVDYDDTVTSVRQFEEILQEEDYPVASVI